MSKAVIKNNCFICSCFCCTEKECTRLKWCDIMKCQEPKFCWRSNPPLRASFKERYKRFKEGVEKNGQK